MDRRFQQPHPAKSGKSRGLLWVLTAGGVAVVLGGAALGAMVIRMATSSGGVTAADTGGFTRITAPPCSLVTPTTRSTYMPRLACGQSATHEDASFMTTLGYGGECAEEASWATPPSVIDFPYFGSLTVSVDVVTRANEGTPVAQAQTLLTEFAGIEARGASTTPVSGIGDEAVVLDMVSHGLRNVELIVRWRNAVANVVYSGSIGMNNGKGKPESDRRAMATVMAVVHDVRAHIS